MELYQLQYFETLARTGSMSAAAEACHVSQPALSLQIKKLEEELGHQLAVRGPRGVALTAAGLRVLHSCRRLREESAGLRRDLRRRHFGPTPRLRIGLQPFLASELIATPLRKFLAERPDWHISLRERTDDRLLDLLLGEQVDACLMTVPANLPTSVEHRPLFPMRYAAFCLPTFALAKRKSVSLRELVAFPLMVYHDSSELVERLHAAAAKRGHDANLVLGSDHALTAFELAATGVGIALLPRALEDRALRRGLQAVPIRDSGISSQIAAVWRQRDGVPDGLERLLELFELPTQR